MRNNKLFLIYIVQNYDNNKYQISDGFIDSKIAEFGALCRSFRIRVIYVGYVRSAQKRLQHRGKVTPHSIL